MALKTSTFPKFIFSNAARLARSFSPKTPFYTNSTAPYNQFQSEFIRRIHRTSYKLNDTMSPSLSSLSPTSEDKLPSQKPVSEKEQISLDNMVNSYPTARRFIAIGSGGDDFADAMIFAVESVLQKPIPDASVRKRLSSMGRYISVNIGPVQVISRDQVSSQCVIISLNLVEHKESLELQHEFVSSDMSLMVMDRSKLCTRP